MTPPRSPAGHAGRILVRADETDVGILSQVIAEAFFDLPPSRWLVPDPATRRAIFPAYFRLYVEHALACGLVHTTPHRDAVALWLPAGSGSPGPPSDYRARLAAITGPLAARFEAFDAALEARHPVAVSHQHLAILAVRPGQQGHGTGTALLAARHAALDAEGIRIPASVQPGLPQALPAARLHRLWSPDRTARRTRPGPDVASAPRPSGRREAGRQGGREAGRQQ